MLTQDALDDEDFPLEDALDDPGLEAALADPSHPELEPRHPEDDGG